MTLSPDELIVGNVGAVHDSKATDASAKRKHTDLSDEYVNEHVRSKGLRTEGISGSQTLPLVRAMRKVGWQTLANQSGGLVGA